MTPELFFNRMNEVEVFDREHNSRCQRLTTRCIFENYAIVECTHCGSTWATEAEEKPELKVMVSKTAANTVTIKDLVRFAFASGARINFDALGKRSRA